jgi:pantoate--beta-alanine ligase
MIVVRSVGELRSVLRSHRSQNRIAFVPTMGALHEGHRSLVRAAGAATDLVVMSIFVNPLQFGPHEDLARYPRDLAADLELAQKDRVGVVFCPSVEEMYPEGASTTISVGHIGEVFEGKARPGHFTGVATVVAKLFNIVEPDAAFFGQKDAQQVAVIRRMVADLSFDVEVIACPTVRDRDGLALSTRNRYLAPAERVSAGVLARALEAGASALASSGDFGDAEKQMWDTLISQDGIEPDYAAAVDASSFGPPRRSASILLAVAARIGTTRLIDNRSVDLPLQEAKMDRGCPRCS